MKYNRNKEEILDSLTNELMDINIKEVKLKRYLLEDGLDKEYKELCYKQLSIFREYENVLEDRLYYISENYPDNTIII